MSVQQKALFALYCAKEAVSDSTFKVAEKAILDNDFETAATALDAASQLTLAAAETARCAYQEAPAAVASAAVRAVYLAIEGDFDPYIEETFDRAERVVLKASQR